MSQPPSASSTPTFAERIRDYLTVFAIGIVVAGVVGVVLVVFGSSVGFASAFGYTLVAFGTLLLLVGGVAGGGYSKIGTGFMSTLRGAWRPHSEETATSGEPTATIDPADIPKPSIHPKRRGVDPAAFWQVMGGFAYFALGSLVVLVFAS